MSSAKLAALLVAGVLLTCWTGPNTLTRSGRAVGRNSSQLTSALQEAGEETDSVRKRLLSYILQAERDGPQRMLVRFNLPFISEPRLRESACDADAVVKQRKQIFETQTCFLEEIGHSRTGFERLFKTVPYLAVDLGAQELENMVALISADGQTLFLPLGGRSIEFDYEPNLRHRSLVKDSPFPPGMKSMLSSIQVDQLHKEGYKGSSQTIVVIDDGVDERHVQLSNHGNRKKVLGGSFFSHKSPNLCKLTSGCIGPTFGQPLKPKTFPRFSHGTNVAILCAGWNSEDEDAFLVPGIAPEACIVSIRVEDEFGGKYAEDVGAALEQVQLHWSKIASPVAAVCISLGSDKTFVDDCDQEGANSGLLYDLVSALKELDIVVVVAAGNQNSEGLSFPACLSNVVAVATSSVYAPQDGYLNWSPHADLVAPGLGLCIPNLINPGNHGFSGTSAAAPQVAGAIALLRAATGCAPDEIIAALKASSVSACKDNMRLPFLQVQESLERLKGKPCGKHESIERACTSFMESLSK